MRFVTLIVSDGDNKRAVTINMDHVVKVDHDEDEVVIRLSNGDAHYLDNDSKSEFRAFLQILNTRTRGNPDR